MAKKPPRTIGTVVARQPVLERLEGVAELMEESAKAPPVLEAGAEQEDAQKRERAGLRSWRKEPEARVSIRLTPAELKLWQSVAWTDDQSLTELVHRAVGAEIKKRERKRGEKYPPELPEGQKMPTGPRGGYR